MKKANKNTSVATSTFYTCLMIVLTTLTIFNISYYYFSKPKVSYIVKDTVDSKISFWKSFLALHPSYFEGWVELSRLDIQNGDKSGAITAFHNAWKINPNSIEAQRLKSILEN